MRSKLTMIFALSALLGLQVASVSGQVAEGDQATQKKETIAAELADAEDYRTLAAAIEAAGLESALAGEGPFTVFAPTEEAFKKVGAEKLEDLMREENRPKLVALLKAHVASGTWTADRISEVSEIPTVDGGAITVSMQDKKLMVGDATVDLKKCLTCKNGLIHCIDEVLPARQQVSSE